MTVKKTFTSEEALAVATELWIRTDHREPGLLDRSA